MTHNHWSANALCISYPNIDFTNTAHATDAIRVCVECPVRAQCEKEALARAEQFGVWGGTTPLQRADILGIAPETDAGKPLRDRVKQGTPVDDVAAEFGIKRFTVKAAVLGGRAATIENGDSSGDVRAAAARALAKAGYPISALVDLLGYTSGYAWRLVQEARGMPVPTVEDDLDWILKLRSQGKKFAEISEITGHRVNSIKAAVYQHVKDRPVDTRRVTELHRSGKQNVQIARELCTSVNRVRDIVQSQTAPAA